MKGRYRLLLLLKANSGPLHAYERREWDSNPREPVRALPIFKTGAFNRSAIPPYQPFPNGLVRWRNTTTRHLEVAQGRRELISRSIY